MGVEDSAHALNGFLQQYLSDRATGQERATSEYQRLFPAAADAIGDLLARLEAGTVGGSGGEDARIEQGMLTDLHNGVTRPLLDYLAEYSGDPIALAKKYADRLPAPDETSSGERIGPYAVIEEIGRGGQARVFLARDTRLPRRVALKVVERSVLTGGEELARMRREAEATSRLNDPRVSQIYEFGEVEGRMFIAMRYVEGESLANALAAASSRGEQPSALELPPAQESGSDSAHDSKRLVGVSSKRGTIARVLEFVEHAARALHAVHELGIVHRDVKPGNIMVALDGSPVILDFGLAQDPSSDAAGITRTGALLGTPAYMSPEQVRGHTGAIDARTDIYALGVVLYECLTLRRPFTATTLEELSLKIVDGSHRDVRELNGLVPKDLAVVLQAAMATDPKDRFLSAQVFADELRRVRLNEPIRTRPPSLVKRTAKWAQRHPAIAASAVLLFVALVTITVLFVQMRGAFRHAERQAAKAEAINEFLLTRMLEAATPQNLGQAVRVVDVLDVARLELADAFREEPQTEAAVRLTLGAAYSRLDLLEPAAALLAQAHADLEERVSTDATELLRAKQELARLAGKQGELTESLALFEAVHAAYRRTLGESHARTLSAKAEVGVPLFALGREEEAIAATRTASEEAERALGPSHRATLECQRRWAQLLLYQSPRAALEVLQNIIEHIDPEDDYALSQILPSLARAQLDAGQYEDADAVSQQAVEVATRIFGEDGLQRWKARQQRAEVLQALRRYRESATLKASVASALQRILGPENPTALLARNDHAISLRLLGELDEAEKIAREVLDTRERVGDGERRIVESLGTLAVIALEQGQHDPAMAYFADAEARARAAFGDHDPLVEENLYNRAVLLKRMGQHVRAETAFRDLLEVERVLYGEDHPFFASVTEQIGRSLLEQGELSRAEPELRRALALRIECLPEGHRDIFASQLWLGIALQRLGRSAEAIEHLVEARAGLASTGAGGLFTSGGGAEALVQAQSAPTSAE